MVPRLELQYSWRDFAAAVGGITMPSPGPGDLALPGFPAPLWDIIPTRRGREALHLILRCQELPEGARIGTPLFACSCLADTIVASGMTPVFIDSEPATFGINLDDLARKRNQIDALLLVHLLGLPADFDGVRAVIGRIPIIEDCAHAVGSSYRGSAVGSLSETSFFSFGFFKPVAVGGGGSIATRDGALAVRIRNLLEESPEESGADGLLSAARSLARGIAYRPIPYTLISNVGRLRAAQMPQAELPERSPEISPVLRMRRSDSGVLRARLARWASNADLELWQAVRASLPPGYSMPEESPFGSWNHFMMAARAPDAARAAAVVALLRSRGVGAAPLYPNCVAETARAGYRGGCPVAEDLARTVFLVPSHAGMPRSARTKLLDVFDHLGKN